MKRRWTEALFMRLATLPISDLIRSRPVTNQIVFSFRKDLFFSMRVQHVLRAHLI